LVLDAPEGRATVVDDRLQGVAGKGRYFAMGIDATTAAALGLLSASLLDLPNRGRMGLAMGVYLLYFLVQEGAWSTTVGKRIFGLYVLRLDGSRWGWFSAAIRTAARFIEVNPILPFGALPGAIAVAASKRRQRLGDMAAGTVVVPRKPMAPEMSGEGVQQGDAADKALP
jgi:uncharacterized RDD family membrane protein YckC